MILDMKESVQLLKEELTNIEETAKKSGEFKTPKKITKKYNFKSFSPNLKNKVKLAESLGIKSNNRIRKTFITFLRRLIDS